MIPRLTSGWLLACALACTTPTEVVTMPAAGQVSVRRLALLPIRPGPAFGPARAPRISGEYAAEIVNARVQEALLEIGGFDVVPLAEVRRVVAAELEAGAAPDPTTIAGRLRSAFGIDAVVYGTVLRFDARGGGPRGAATPASVAFSLEMRHADGRLLWKGIYDETQMSLAEDPRSFQRARARGFSWVTAEALTRYGAVELVRQMPGSEDHWR